MKISDQFDVYKTILDTLPDRVFIISQSGVIVDVLGGGGANIKLNKRTLIGYSFNDLFGLENAKPFYDVVQQAINKNAIQVYQYSVDPKIFENLPNGPHINQTQWYEGRIQALPYKIGSESAVVWISRNTTKNHLLQKELKQQVECDYLTGTLSHRSFFNRAEQCFNCTKQYCKATSLLLIDIDHFKSVNDTFGHLAGDAVLKQTAATIKETLREVDFLGRVGGEEFAVLLIETNIEDAYSIAEKIRIKIENMLSHYKSNTIKITISIGISNIYIDDTDVTVAYDRADKALYQSKVAGRNQTTTSLYSKE